MEENKQLEIIEQKIKSFGDKIEEQINDHVNAIKSSSKDEYEGYKKELKGSITDLTEKYNALIDEKDGLITKMQEQIDQLEVDNQKLSDNELGVKTFEQVFKEKTDDYAKIKQLFGDADSRKKASLDFDIDTKAVVLESTSLSGALGVIAPGRRPGVLVKPEEANHIRQIMNVGSTSSNVWAYTQESAYTDSTAPIAEGTLFPQSDFQLEIASQAVKKVAAHMKMSNELLEDIPGLMTFVQGRMTTKYMLVEDNQLLLGDGTGQNFSGLFTNATAFGPTLFKNSYAGNNSRDTDVLALAINQARVTTANGLFNPDIVIMNPTDVTSRQLERTTDGWYLLPDIYTDGATPVKGVRIFQSTIMTQGSYLVGDFSRGSEIIDRRLLNLQVSTEDQDDFVKDLATVRLSSRLALPIYFTGAFVGGTFAAGKDYLNASPVTP